MQPDRVHRSAVDWWIALILLAGAALVPLLLALALTGFGRDLVGSASMLVAAAIMASTLTGLVWPVRYTLAGEVLVVRSGLLRQRVRLADITSVEPTRALWSSPALSSRRLRIRYGASWILVSPRDRDAFLADLAARCNGLVLVGDRLERAG